MSMNEQLLYRGYGLSSTQVEYLRFIIEYAKDHKGNSPSIAVIAEHFTKKWSTARWHVGELSNKRLLQLRDGEIEVEKSIWEPPPELLE